MDDPHHSHLHGSGPSLRSRPTGSRRPVQQTRARRLDQARVQAAQRRDAALERIGSTRRWAIAGAAGLSAGFAALVYALAPGHTLSSAGAATGGSGSNGAVTATHGSQPPLPAPAGPSALGLQGGGSSSEGSSPPPAPAQSAPAPAPAPAPSSPPVTSGGS